MTLNGLPAFSSCGVLPIGIHVASLSDRAGLRKGIVRVPLLEHGG